MGFLKDIKDWLAGKKTYFFGVGSIIAGTYSFLVLNVIDLDAYIQIVQTAFASMFIRAGVANEVNKVS